MRDVRNPKLRRILNAEGIKDVVLNFSEGFVLVWSEDDSTNDILHRADNSIETRLFKDYTVEEWADMIREIFYEGLENAEESKKWQSGEYKLKMSNTYKTNIDDSRRMKDAVATVKEQERMLTEDGVITQKKLNELIERFKKNYDKIPINIVDEQNGYDDIDWARISVSALVGEYLLKINYLYAGFIDPETGEVSLDVDDGASWIYVDNYYQWVGTSEYEDACYAFMGGQEEEFMEAIRAGFDEYAKKKYKKYFKKTGKK